MPPLRVKNPFSGHFFTSVTHHFKSFSRSTDLTFKFWKKKCIYKCIFFKLWLNFSSRGTNFSENSLPQPQFQAPPKKFSYGDPTFQNMENTYLTKNYLTTLSQSQLFWTVDEEHNELMRSLSTDENPKMITLSIYFRSISPNMGGTRANCWGCKAPWWGQLMLL